MSLCILVLQFFLLFSGSATLSGCTLRFLVFSMFFGTCCIRLSPFHQCPFKICFIFFLDLLFRILFLVIIHLSLLLRINFYLLILLLIRLSLSGVGLSFNSFIGFLLEEFLHKRVFLALFIPRHNTIRLYIFFLNVHSFPVSIVPPDFIL